MWGTSTWCEVSIVKDGTGDHSETAAGRLICWHKAISPTRFLLVKKLGNDIHLGED